MIGVHSCLCGCFRDMAISNYEQLLQALHSLSVLYLSEHRAVRSIDAMLFKHDCNANACSVSGGETVAWRAIDTLPYAEGSATGDLPGLASPVATWRPSPENWASARCRERALPEPQVRPLLAQRANSGGSQPSRRDDGVDRDRPAGVRVPGDGALQHLAILNKGEIPQRSCS